MSNINCFHINPRITKFFLLLVFFAITTQNVNAHFALTNPNNGTGQIYKFWVTFKNKPHAAQMMQFPRRFLSEKAIARRLKNGVGVDETDVPVNPAYVIEIMKCGITIQHASRWMNAVLIHTTDSSDINKIKKFSFIQNIELKAILGITRGIDFYDPQVAERKSTEKIKEKRNIAVKNREYNENNLWGMGFRQAQMLGVDKLHEKGLKGKGIDIAVIDAGFYAVDELACFEHIFKQHRFLGSYDFINKSNDVFLGDEHGTQVLSTMAAFSPGYFIGTAPEANYLLLRTEDAHTELPVEEVYWLMAAELADSMGVDIINSSLGYTKFDMPQFNRNMMDLNGKTTLITKAANIAFEKGMLIFCSAGNEGNLPFHYIGAPADAEGSIAVAAVNHNNQIAPFSSVGNLFTRNVKPDLSALGTEVYVSTSYGYYLTSNGTSYAAPILCGGVACVLQAAGNASASKIRDALFLAGDRIEKPDTFYGKGIPNLVYTVAHLRQEKPQTDWLIGIQDTIRNFLLLRNTNLEQGVLKFRILNNEGRQVISGTFSQFKNHWQFLRLQLKESGKYKIVIEGEKENTQNWFYFAKNINEV